MDASSTSNTCATARTMSFSKRSVRHAHEMGVARDDGTEMDVYGSFQTM